MADNPIASEDRQPQPEQILLVDDNVTNLQVLHQTLDGRGYKLLVAKNGASALAIAEKAKPSLILLDIMMPEMDGYEVCRRLKGNPALSDIPIIYLSALKDTEDTVKGLELGAVDYIGKPFQPEEVIARVNTHLTINSLKRMLAEKNQELQSTNRQLLKQTRYLNTYLTVSSMVSQCLDPHELLEAVLNVVLETVSAEEASVLLLDEDQANFRFYGIEGPAKQGLMSVTFPADKGIAGSILQTQKSEVVNDVHSDPRFYGKIDSDYGFVIQNLIAIPLTAGEEKIGVMEVINKSGEELFTDEDRFLLDSIAEEIAFAIRNARIFEYVVNSYCKQRQGETSCKGCKRPLRSWTPCAKYLVQAVPADWTGVEDFVSEYS
jgi:DNA-binding response OmpR family regulator